MKLKVIEIIPNWHPLLVHFTVGLLGVAVLFYLAGACLPKRSSWKQQWLNMANWSLWSGSLFAIGTAIAGWFAYNSVDHDSASHAAMTLHRNWALPTAGTFLFLGLWAILIARKDRRPGFMFLTSSLIAAGLLMVTGWLGAEAVYRYGLGVESLPSIEEGADGHNHSHGSGHDELAMNDHQHDKTETGPMTADSHPHLHENTEIISPHGGAMPAVETGTYEQGHHGAMQDELIMSKHQHTPEQIEQSMQEAGSRHEHINSTSEIESSTKTVEQTSKTSSEDSAESSMQILAKEVHEQVSKSTDLSDSPLHTEIQDKETHNHEH